MKILHVDPETHLGGGERQVLGLIRHLARRGHENVLAAPAEGALARLVPAADARLVPLAIRNDVDLVAAFRLGRAVARERPHVVHYHTARAHKISLWLRAFAGRSIVTRRMDYPIRRGFVTDQLYGRAVAAVAAISEGVRRELLAAGVAAERIRVIPSGVETPTGLPGEAGRRAARARFGVGDDRVAIGIVAALERRKAHDVLFRAIATARARPRLVCIVCGDGSERGNLERLAGELGIAADVRFLGEQRQVADVLAALDVFALPSRAEGLGVAILEAMAMALPVVASRIGGIPEAVLDGTTGILVPAGDPGALSAALDRLAADGDERRRMGDRGRERVAAEFSLARTAERYEELYGEIQRLPREPA